MQQLESLLDYWFGDLQDGFADESHRRLWFNGGPAFDQALRDRFAHLITAVEGGDLTDPESSPQEVLAFVLTCDQLPRNLFRDTPRAFASDHLALAAARHAVECGWDLALGFDQRAFLYLPFEHSESLVDQHTSVGLFSELRDQTPMGMRDLTGGYLRFAHQHRDVIRRFGRFPHRNAVLGRASSPEEQAYLSAGGGF